MTLNEMRSFVDIGYRDGRHAPGLKLPPPASTRSATTPSSPTASAYKPSAPTPNPATKVGLAENAEACAPVIETPDHIAAARKAMREENAGYLTAVLEGKYTDAYLAHHGANAPKFTAADMKAIGSPIDFVGLNNYTTTWVRASTAPPDTP